MMGNQTASTMFRKNTILIGVCLLVLVWWIAVSPASLPVLAEAEGDGGDSGDEVIIIDTGDDLNIPDDDFGLGTDQSSAPRGILTGEIHYTYAYSEQNGANPLNKDALLFEINEEKHLFEVQLNYDYNLRTTDRVHIGAILSELNEGQGLKANLKLTEAFANLNLKQAGTLIVGKQKLNFGQGFCWTPTGLYLDNRDLDGVTSLRWSLPYWKLGLTTVAIPPLAERERAQLYERLDLTLNKLNLALSGYVEDKGKARFGLDCSGFIGDVELYTVVSLKQENTRQYLKTGTVTFPFVPNEEFNTYEFEPKDSEQWYVSGILGGTYAIPGTNNAFLMAEYYYDPTGLTKEQIAAVADAADYCTAMVNSGKYEQFHLPDQYKGVLAQLNDYFKPGQMGRNYFFAGIQNLQYAKILTANLVGIVNLDDQSGVLNPELALKLTDSTNVVFSGNLFFGKEKSEFALRAVEKTLKIGTVIHF